MLSSMVMLTACYPPQVQYPYSVMVTNRRALLKDNLIALLPLTERVKPAAREEARWLADTAYKAAAGISRVNGSYFPGWAGNAFINARLQDRGLCWHYQHDMFRELRRKPLRYFRLGFCVRDKERPTEHNCLYIAAKNGVWPHCWVLDAWMWNGRLKVDKGTELNQNRWQDLPSVLSTQQRIYPEGHDFPIEHWSVVRDVNGSYDLYWLDNTRRSSQYHRMYDNIQQGKQQHPHSPTNY